MAMMGLQWQLAMMSADSLHSVLAAMMRDHLCWLHLYVVLYHYDGIKVEEMRDKEEYAGGEWCKILRSSKLLEVSDTDR